jgi:hypothetical protein
MKMAEVPWLEWRRCDGTGNDHDGRDVHDVNISTSRSSWSSRSFRELVGPLCFVDTEQALS